MTNLLTLPEAAGLAGTNISIVVDALGRDLPFIALKGRSGDVRIVRREVEQWMHKTARR